jgi:murein DD-endopeptidase MepM/ murein hydrolase activator NlpD
MTTRLAALFLLATACVRGGEVEERVPRGLPLADGFDWPVGAPDAHGYVDAQPFGVNLHLGEDWNALGASEADLGAPVTAVAHGRVTAVGHRGPGWGQVVRVAHRVRDGAEDRVVESFYAHLDAMEVEVGEVVLRGQRLGTIGDADGAYGPHLHFELRARVGLPDGLGYGDPPRYRLDPSDFIRDRRPRRVARR